eukprot:TRINITY_DN973_c0_g1_i11.p1 TRINITY_DN973_c0_g1~~TRINITY_DN973_c0_g1_i11.p1  ORF type:complete len:138 (+),score=11.56 TRINITY_DN973_c0_g1_i11:357-770(+)
MKHFLSPNSRDYLLRVRVVDGLSRFRVRFSEEARCQRHVIAARVQVLQLEIRGDHLLWLADRQLELSVSVVTAVGSCTTLVRVEMLGSKAYGRKEMETCVRDSAVCLGQSCGYCKSGRVNMFDPDTMIAALLASPRN